MSESNLLEIKNLAVSVDGKEILHEINLAVKPGETNVVFGPNGSGKTTLMMAIMGFPRYRITRERFYSRDRILPISLWMNVPDWELE